MTARVVIAGSTVETLQGWAAVRNDGSLIDKFPTQKEAEAAVEADFRASRDAGSRS